MRWWHWRANNFPSIKCSNQPHNSRTNSIRIARWAEACKVQSTWASTPTSSAIISIAFLPIPDPESACIWAGKHQYRIAGSCILQSLWYFFLVGLRVFCLFRSLGRRSCHISDCLEIGWWCVRLVGGRDWSVVGFTAVTSLSLAMKRCFCLKVVTRTTESVSDYEVYL